MRAQANAKVIKTILCLITTCSFLSSIRFYSFQGQGSSNFFQSFQHHRQEEDESIDGILLNTVKQDDYSSTIEVSVAILTYRKTDALARALPSILQQHKFTNLEVILIDNGCLNATKAIFHHEVTKYTTVPYKYLPLCDNPGYAAGNNAAIKVAAPTSKYFLLLNDDIVLSNQDFIYSMIQLANSKKNAAAIGCKILNADGDRIIEAGSIVWDNGSAAGYGRGRKDIDAPEFSYPKPVDYISGTCLLVEKEVFVNRGGFDEKTFPNYYEDTDLQMHIQHDLGREVWFQPKAIGLHDEHGSFGNDDSVKLMHDAAQKFYIKWKHFLKGKHVQNPLILDGNGNAKAFFDAADLRARNTKVANILYIDEKAPNKSRGGGFGRSFDNLSMIVDLGHRVTLITFDTDNTNWCDDRCVDEITGLGIEYVISHHLTEELFKSRIGYYDIVIVNRPSTLFHMKDTLRNFDRQSSFSLIYDCGSLWFRRNEILSELVKEKDIQFPGYNPMQISEKEIDKDAEIALFAMANTVITVSNQEKKSINSLVPNINNIKTIGHVMDTEKITKRTFNDRNGILFLASFDKSMFYNGDSMWYFAKEIYPLVIKESASSPIPLTIAGRGIPEELIKLVDENEDIKPYITFLESPPTVDLLFEENRVFIAPHLYGSGIQYKISESLSVGLPVVMSSFTKESFGDDVPPGCVGADPESFMKCIIDLHNNEKRWNAIREDGIAYIKQTHNRADVMDEWAEVINENFKKEVLVEENHNLLYTHLNKEEGASEYKQSTWQENLCIDIKDPVCNEVFVLDDLKATFCSAANVATTEAKTYFSKVSKKIFIPDGASHGIHEANWIRLHMLDRIARKKLLSSPDWTHIFFWKNVVERFVSVYLDKVVVDCKSEGDQPIAIHYYSKYGFSCNKHQNLEDFISFMESVPQFEANFHSQTTLCSVGRFPITDFVNVKTLSTTLHSLSLRLGVDHPPTGEWISTTHSTDTKTKMVELFKDKPHLIQRILNMFPADCEALPHACNVDDLMDAIEEENQ